MEYRYLGSTGLRVSAFCLGTMTFGRNEWGIGSLTQAEAQELVSAALDAGINFFDTADIYSAGESEEILGKALGGRRQGVVVATKARMPMGEGPNDVGLSRVHLMRSVENSLRRLGTDYIDLYQVHCWDRGTPLAETLAALDDMVRQGKVRYVGCSNFAAWQLARSLSVSEARNLVRFETLQPHYNLLCRDIEDEIVPLCLDQGIGILPWSPLSEGRLTGKYRRGQARPEGARLSSPENGFLKIPEEKLFDVVEALDEVVSRHEGATVPQAALNWVAAQPGVTSVIIGARRLSQLQDNLAAASWTMTPDDLSDLDAASRPAPRYPRWFIDMFNQDR